MSPAKRATIRCSSCGQVKTHRAHGWCHTCYNRWFSHGKPEGGPPPRQDSGPRPAPPAEGAVPSQPNRRRGVRKPKRGGRADIPARADWTPAQRKLAHHIVLGARGTEDRRLLLEAVGLAPASDGEQERAA